MAKYNDMVPVFNSNTQQLLGLADAIQATSKAKKTGNVVVGALIVADIFLTGGSLSIGYQVGKFMFGIGCDQRQRNHARNANNVLDMETTSMLEFLRAFQGLEHACQLLRSIDKKLKGTDTVVILAIACTPGNAMILGDLSWKILKQTIMDEHPEGAASLNNVDCSGLEVAVSAIESLGFDAAADVLENAIDSLQSVPVLGLVTSISGLFNAVKSTDETADQLREIVRFRRESFASLQETVNVLSKVRQTDWS